MIPQESSFNYDKKIKVLLTNREKQVLDLLSIGFTDIEIGRKIFLSQSTVKTHRSNLLRKFNARNSCHLVFLATKQEQHSLMTNKRNDKNKKKELSWSNDII